MKKNEALIKEWIDKAKSAANKAAEEAKAQASDPTLMMKAANMANQAQAEAAKAMGDKSEEPAEPVEEASNWKGHVTIIS